MMIVDSTKLIFQPIKAMQAGQLFLKWKYFQISIPIVVDMTAPIVNMHKIARSADRVMRMHTNSAIVRLTPMATGVFSVTAFNKSYLKLYFNII
jgi:hypothetical protein